jgi:hypothetical protein
MLRRILWFLVAFPVGALIVTLAVINRHGVRLVMDPFRPDQPVLSLVLPFYVYLFVMLIAGVAIGGLATWARQSRWRRTARRRAAEAERWQAEAGRLARERERELAARPLAPASH